MYVVVYNWFLSGKVVRQNGIDVTSFCVEFEKVGHGLLQDDFHREGNVLLAEREGENKKGSC